MADKFLCKIEGCGKPIRNKARGWCSMHYQRWQKYGDPFAGRVPNGEALRYLREVVLTYDGEACLVWPYRKNADGYGSIDGRCVHRRVCEEVNGPPPTPKHEAAHSCGKGHEACVAKRHISWKTPKENSADKLIHGTIRCGVEVKTSKLTEDDVRVIRTLHGAVPATGIADNYGIHVTQVHRIQRRKAWAWLE